MREEKEDKRDKVKAIKIIYSWSLGFPSTPAKNAVQIPRPGSPPEKRRGECELQKKRKEFSVNNNRGIAHLYTTRIIRQQKDVNGGRKNMFIQGKRKVKPERRKGE
jgi:hypothetical protein